MNKKRINEILNSKDIKEIYFEDKPIWIQEFNNYNNTAKIGFTDGSEEQNVYIEELYEED